MRKFIIALALIIVALLALDAVDTITAYHNPQGDLHSPSVGHIEAALGLTPGTSASKIARAIWAVIEHIGGLILEFVLCLFGSNGDVSMCKSVFVPSCKR